MDKKLIEELNIDIEALYLGMKMEAMLNDLSVNFTVENLYNTINTCFIVDYDETELKFSDEMKTITIKKGIVTSCKIQNLFLDYNKLGYLLLNLILGISQLNNREAAILLTINLIERLSDIVNIELSEKERIVYFGLVQAELEGKRMCDENFCKYIYNLEKCSLNETEIFYIISDLNKKKIISITDGYYKILEKFKVK